MGYEIEQAIGIEHGKVHVFAQHPETNKRVKISELSTQDIWKINDPQAFSMDIDKNQSPRSPSSFNKKELSGDDLVKSNLKLYTKKLSADISRRIASQIDGNNWLKSSKKFTNYSNVVPFVAGSIANPDLYDDGNHAKFMKDHGVIYPNHMINQLSQRVAGNVQDMRKSEQLKSIIANTNMNSRQVQDKIGVHMTKLMSGCGLYSWMKYRWLRARKVVRNCSRWRDKREDCLGLVSMTSSEDDMMADTDSSDDGLPDCSDGDSSGSDSDQSSTDDDQHRRFYFQSKKKITVVKKKKHSLLSDLVHGGENLAKEAAYIITGGSLTHKNKNNASSSYRIQNPKKSVSYQKSKGGNIYQKGYGNQATYVDDRDNIFYVGNEMNQQVNNDDVCITSDDVNVTDSIFQKHWNANKQHIQAPFSTENDYIIFFPTDKLAQNIDMNSPDAIKSAILNHSAAFPKSRQLNGANLTTLRGANNINISNDGELVNGKPSGQLRLLFDADTGYKLWVKPTSVRFN
jgi:hypothetical protein